MFSLFGYCGRKVKDCVTGEDTAKDYAFACCAADGGMAARYERKHGVAIEPAAEFGKTAPGVPVTNISLGTPVVYEGVSTKAC